MLPRKTTILLRSAQENNIFTHNGNPNINFFYCDTTLLDNSITIQPSCEFTDMDGSDQFQYPVYSECSNHGDCNRIKGICVCNNGYHGTLCDDTADREDKNIFFHDGPFYTGNLMKVHAERSLSHEFSLLNAVINDVNITTIRGDGALIHTKDFFTKQSISIGYIPDNKDNEVFPTNAMLNHNKNNLKTNVS